MQNHMRGLQSNVVATGRAVWGNANQDNPRERALRFGEEAMELMRSTGLKFTDVLALARYEFQERMQSPGEIHQEVAGVQNTLFGLASVHDIDVYTASMIEIERILANKDKCREKHDAKPAHLRGEIAA